jgi:hypothetical protein
MKTPPILVIVLALGAALLTVSGCSSASVEDDVNDATVVGGDQAGSASEGETQPDTVLQNFLGDYELTDQQYQTQTTVRLENNQRIMTTNALPNHETGDFPNASNPNAISAQDSTWTLPLVPNFVGQAQDVYETGVAINGVKFEPGTDERVTCDSREIHPIEGLQTVADLGMDFNNAHVQPNGAYHYHGISALMVEVLSSDADLVHVGFARDGYLLYYSKSGQYSPSYKVGSGNRTGSGCLYTPRKGNAVDFGSVKDGALTDDWEYDASYGDLDECNGTMIDDSYAYVITDGFPYIPRCLMGEFVAEDRGPSGADQGPPSDGQQPPSGGPKPPPPAQ